MIFNSFEFITADFTLISRFFSEWSKLFSLILKLYLQIAVFFQSKSIFHLFHQKGPPALKSNSKVICPYLVNTQTGGVRQGEWERPKRNNSIQKQALQKKPQTNPQKLTLPNNSPPLPLSMENQRTDSAYKYSRVVQHGEGEREQKFLLDCGSNSYSRACYCTTSDEMQASFQLKNKYICESDRNVVVLELNRRICQQSQEFTFNAYQVLTTHTQRTENNEHRLKSSNGS